MKVEDFEIMNGLNIHQNASVERNDKTIEYEASKKLSFANLLSIKKGLDVVSEFFDVNAVIMVSAENILAVSLGKSLDEALFQAIDANPVGFLNSNIIVSQNVDSDFVKKLKDSNIIVAPSFTKNAIEYMDMHEIAYVTISTPLKDYKQYLSNETFVTPLGTLTQTPNLSELNKDSFKVVSKIKPTVEQIEDAVFAWKVAKHAKSQAVVVAKDLKTSAISQGAIMNSVEEALDFSCELAKDAIIASDIALSVHDINAAVQCRIALIIVPSATKDLIEVADKYNLAMIVTGVSNLLY